MNSKHVLTILVLNLGILFCNAIAGTPESRLLFTITTQSKARLGVINTSNQTLNLEIANKNGDVFFKETVKAGVNYFKMLDLKKMPDGEYVIGLTGLKQEIKKTFTIGEPVKETVDAGSSDTKKLNEPKFNLNSDETLSVFYNNMNGSQVSISFEQDNSIVFEDKVITSATINKKYSLKQMAQGTYQVKLTAGDKVYSYSFDVK